MQAIRLLALLAAVTVSTGKPKLPQQFVWKGVQWHIDYSDLACPPRADGCTMFGPRVIFLRDDLPLVETKEDYSEPEILMHELAHVVSGDTFAARKMTGHKAISALQSLGELLAANPQLSQYFIDVNHAIH